MASPEQDSGRKDSGASDVPQSKLSAATRASSQRPDREARAAAAKQATPAAPQPISARNVLEGNKPATSSKPLPVQHDVPVDKVPPTTPSHQTPAKEQSTDGRNQSKSATETRSSESELVQLASETDEQEPTHPITQSKHPTKEQAAQELTRLGQPPPKPRMQKPRNATAAEKTEIETAPTPSTSTAFSQNSDLAAATPQHPHRPHSVKIGAGPFVDDPSEAVSILSQPAKVNAELQTATSTQQEGPAEENARPSLSISEDHWTGPGAPGELELTAQQPPTAAGGLKPVEGENGSSRTKVLEPPASDKQINLEPSTSQEQNKEESVSKETDQLTARAPSKTATQQPNQEARSPSDASSASTSPLPAYSTSASSEPRAGASATSDARQTIHPEVHAAEEPMIPRVALGAKAGNDTASQSPNKPLQPPRLISPQTTEKAGVTSPISPFTHQNVETVGASSIKWYVALSLVILVGLAIGASLTPHGRQVAARALSLEPASDSDSQVSPVDDLILAAAQRAGGCFTNDSDRRTANIALVTDEQGAVERVVLPEGFGTSAERQCIMGHLRRIPAHQLPARQELQTTLPGPTLSK